MRQETETPDLLAELAAISAEPRGWNSPRAARLLAFTTKKYTGLARKEGSDPADALEAAWSAWSEPGFRTAQDPWALTSTAIRRALTRSNIAQRKLTSLAGARRPDTEALVGFADDELDSVRDTAQYDLPRVFAGFTTAAAREAYELLISCDVTPDTATAAIESVFSTAAEHVALSTALQILRTETVLPERLGISLTAWRALVGLLLGNPRGDLGLFQAEITGVAAESVKNIRNARRRLEMALAADANRVRLTSPYR